MVLVSENGRRILDQANERPRSLGQFLGIAWSPFAAEQGTTSGNKQEAVASTLKQLCATLDVLEAERHSSRLSLRQARSITDSQHFRLLISTWKALIRCILSYKSLYGRYGVANLYISQYIAVFSPLAVTRSIFIYKAGIQRMPMGI